MPGAVAVLVEGLVILRDGDPGEPSVTLSPVTYLYEHRAELDVAVPLTGRTQSRTPGI